jgi:hypothetical protein
MLRLVTFNCYNTFFYRYYIETHNRRLVALGISPTSSGKRDCVVTKLRTVIARSVFVTRLRAGRPGFSSRQGQ